MANAIKRTKRMNIVEMLENEVIKSNENWVAYLENELRLLDNKKTGTRKPTKTQLANQELFPLVLDVIASADEPITVGAMLKTGRFEEGMSTQKLTGLLGNLWANGSVIREKVKGQYVYTVAEK